MSVNSLSGFRVSGCVDHFAWEEKEAYDYTRNIVSTLNFQLPEEEEEEEERTRRRKAEEEPPYDSMELLGLAPKSYNYSVDVKMVYKIEMLVLTKQSCDIVVTVLNPNAAQQYFAFYYHGVCFLGSYIISVNPECIPVCLSVCPGGQSADRRGPLPGVQGSLWNHSGHWLCKHTWVKYTHTD